MNRDKKLIDFLNTKPNEWFLTKQTAYETLIKESYHVHC